MEKTPKAAAPAETAPQETIRKPAADCATMDEVRAAIDALDRDLVRLLAARSGYIDRAADLKGRLGLPAFIGWRVEEVVARVRGAAGEAGVDPELAEALWRKLIAWSVAREEQMLGKDGDG